MVKQFLALSVAAMFMLIPPPVSAEQSAAENYRQLINSGKFFLEYSQKTDLKDKKSSMSRYMAAIEKYDVGGKQIAYSNGRKIFYSKMRSLDSVKGESSTNYQKYLPVALYKDGKYYQFYGKDKAIVGEEQYFSADYTDPSENWNSIKSELELPAFLGALLPDNPNISFIGGIKDKLQLKNVSTFIESGTAKIFGQTFNYDKYSVKKFNSDGTKLGKFTDPRTGKKYDADFTETYTFYYNANGELKYVKEDGRFSNTNARVNAQKNSGMFTGEIYISIEKFTGDIPTGFFSFPKGCKVYQMDMGTLADLLDAKEIVEQY